VRTMSRIHNARAVTLSAAVPADTSAQEKAALARLAALPGGEFDEAFKQTIDDIHRRELALYEAEAKSSTSPELHTLVQGRVVSLRKNLVDRPPAKQEQDW
jgi:predicted outer membrane protein